MPPEASLPADVLCKVFRCLHLRCRMRFRAVCKLWNTLLSSEQCFLHAQESPWICMLRSDGKETVWCPESGVMFETASNLLFTPSWSSEPLSNILASSNGLVLGVSGDRLAVGNPLTRKWNKLPNLQKIAHFNMFPRKLKDLSPSCASMVVDPSSGNYKIVMRLPLREKSKSLLNALGLMLFYDSTSCIWNSRRTSLDWRCDRICSPRAGFEQSPFLASSLVSISAWGICTLDVQTGDQCNLCFNNSFDCLKRYAYHDYEHPWTSDDEYRLGSFKGRCISFKALTKRDWGYEVSELEYEAPTLRDYKACMFQSKAGQWKVLDTFLDPTESLGDYKQWFFFEGDYAVAFCERGALAYNMDKLTWHHTQLPLGLSTNCKGCLVFSPSLTSPNGDALQSFRVQPKRKTKIREVN